MEEKILDISGIKIFVTRSGGGRPCICLHGWGRGVSSEAFSSIREHLKDAEVDIIAPDLPGFGKSDEPPRAWTVDDYADCIEELVKQLKVKDVFLLGHSFGGRIAIKLAARQSALLERSPEANVERPLHSPLDTLGAQSRRAWISHLFLCASAGVGRDLLIRRRFWLIIAKIGNAIFFIPGLSLLKPFARKVLYKLLRVRDYSEASERMRETMKAVIEEDLTPLLSKIAVPTDLFWGTEDTLTPLRDGQLMNKKIVQSTLHVFPGARHNVHREKALEIAQIIRFQLSAL